MRITLPTLRDALHALFGLCDGMINFRALGPGYQTSCFYALTNAQGIASFLGTHVADRDIYWGMATRVDDSSAATGNCLHLNALFVDLDFGMSSEAEVRKRLEHFLFGPSLVIHSGGGLHCSWLMAEPFNLQVPAEAEQAGALLRRLAACLEADPSAAEIARVLRVPHTFNRKPEHGTPRRVIVEVCDPTLTYNPSDFDSLLPAESVAATPKGKFAVPDVAGPSERNATLFKLGRSLKAKKVAPAAILEALKATNAQHCVPPHAEAEVARVFDSVMRRRDRASLATGSAFMPRAVLPASPVPNTPELAPPESVTPEPTTPEPAASEPAAPAPAAPALARLLEATAVYVRRFVVMTEPQAAALALWVAHCHTFQAADATPYIHVTAATKRAGKTLLLEALEPIVAKPWFTGRTTAAALPRKIDAQQPTLLLDETDQALTENSDYSKALIGVLNTGYRQSGTTSLCMGEGAGLKVVDLHTFCPKAIAGIGKLPDTVADRCIKIKLRRRTRAEHVERARARAIQGAATPLRVQWQAWAPAAARALLGASPALPDPLDDRAQDVWEPLLAVAELAGGGWAERARQAAIALSGSRQDEDYGTLLLSDIRDVMDAATVKDERGPAFDVISSTALLKRLNRLKEQPWPTWSKGNEMTPHALAGLLAGFEVRSSLTWTGGRGVRGYRRAVLEELFPRYLGIKVLERENVNNDGPELAFSKCEESENPNALKSDKSPIDPGVPNALTLQPPLQAGVYVATPEKGGRNGQPDHRPAMVLPALTPNQTEAHTEKE